jgi:hypothetical protein
VRATNMVNARRCEAGPFERGGKRFSQSELRNSVWSVWINFNRLTISEVCHRIAW